MNTWSGQPEELAWHWTPENCQKLGHVIQLLKSGTAERREQAYQEFIEIKRWFVEEEFDDYLNRLEDFQVSMGGEPLRKVMEEIQRQRAPVTGWKAKPGTPIDPVMLPEMIIETTPYGEDKHLKALFMESNKWRSDEAAVWDSQRYIKDVDKYTRYDLFITLIKKGLSCLGNVKEL